MRLLDKELFKKTEGKLYRYYQSKKKIYVLKNEIDSLDSTKETIEYDIRHANVAIDYYQNGTGIQERVQSSPTGSSYAETEMCKEIEKLEKEHLKINRKILKIKSKIRELEEFIRYMDNNIEQLGEEDKRFLELKYGDKKNLLYISIKLNMSKTTAYRKREELIDNISEYEQSIIFWEKNGKKSGISRMNNSL